MPIRTVPGTDVQYYLIVFDEDGKERRESDGTLLSETLRQRVADPTAGVTHVFFTSHGWKGDVPAAIEQYDAWITAMEGVQSDSLMAREQNPGFRPLIVGLHWPSLPWGDEEIPNRGGPGMLSLGTERAAALEAQVDAYAARIADSRKARTAIRTILQAARHDPDSATLTPQIRAAYDTLFQESGLGSGDATGRPGADQDGFDAAAIITEARAGSGGEPAGGPHAPGVLGIGDELREALIMPLRQLSFWKMKDRARKFGEAGGHELLCRLQQAAPNAHFHLMGHSFGCIVVSATVAGPPNGQLLPRPVESLFLVQGALSLWSYAADIPYAPGRAGYFYHIVKNGLVRGPIVTTRSTLDTAVGRFYPMGAKLKKQLVLADTKFPKYGGVGSFGVQGLSKSEDMPMQSATYAYHFGEGRVYNLDASGIIKNGTGPSGAHSDIAHPEVAHVFWAAVLSLRSSSGGATRLVPPLPTLRDVESSVLGKAEKPLTVRPSAAEAPPEQRWINAELEDHAPNEPLDVGRWYTLAFDVDVGKRANAIGAAPLDDAKLFADRTDEVQLTVQLDSDDFEISDRTRPLRLPRAGQSRGKARFDISPKHNGTSTIKATFHKDGNFILQMELTFDVGATGATGATLVQVTSRGRPPSAASVVQPRDVSLSISPAAGGGYDCVVFGNVSSRARLPIQQAYLASAINAARQELMKVVMYQNAAGEYSFQTGIDIPDADCDMALRTMARAGALLFQKIFFGPAAGADSKAVGEFLRKIASDRGTRLKLQIVAESTPVPWGLLYVGDASAAAKLDWDGFIGMGHVIELIPLQTTLSISDSAIPSDKPELAVSVNTNDGIDEQMGSDFVAQQQSFWNDAAKSRKRVRVTSRSTSVEVVKALANGNTDDQILYFYCHAESAELTDVGGPDSSCIVLTDARITLGDLSLDAPTTTQLKGSPLVFINACESAELSPVFYDGFVPYFMAKGARGVIGTECKTPALFAVAWAKRFFERFLDGAPLGEIFLDLRREFLEKHRNPLGLMYAVHCDGDTLIQPALTAAS